MDCNTLSSSCQLEDKGYEKISISDEISRLEHSTLKSDSFIVDMERFSHVTTKDVNPNSRITVCFSWFVSFLISEHALF